MLFVNRGGISLERIVVVSGATSGIGLAIAQSLCADGHIVVGFGRSPAKAADQIAELRRNRGDHALELRSLDVRNVQAVKHFITDIAARLGRIDILINAAGVLAAEPSEEVNEESFDNQVDTILKGVFFLTTAAIPVMRQQGLGLVINIGSIAGDIASPKMAAYAAAKAGVISLTKSFALEYASLGIRFVCVSPGIVETNLMNKLMIQMIAKKSPLKRATSTQEVAEYVKFLISDGAAQFTGVNLVMAGGIGL
jgi:3-oxoacyl-[acyl-carrier protein] reductase